MATAPGSQSNAHNKKQVRGFYGGYWEIGFRIFRFTLILSHVVIFAAALGVNGSIKDGQYPESITNCSNLKRVGSLDPDGVRNSVTIFSSVFLAVSVIAFAFLFGIFMIKLLSPGMIENAWKGFFWVENIMTQILTHAYAGVVVGSFLMGGIVSGYFTVFEDEFTDNDTLKKFRVVASLMWATFGISISSYIQMFFNHSELIWAGAKKYYGVAGCGKRDGCNGNGDTEMDKKVLT